MGKALLIIILGFSFIFGSMMMNVTSNHQRSAKSFVQQYEKWIARNAVESATNVANSKLFEDFDWRTGFTNQSFSGAGYSVTVTDITGDSTTEAKKIEVKTIVNYENVIDSTIAVFIQPAYSYYCFFLENWPATLEYDSGDTLIGRIHANDKIRIRDDPVFLGKVSSSDDTYQDVGSAIPKFYGGVEFGTQSIPMPVLIPLIDSINAGGDVYDEESWLTFFDNSTYACSSTTNNPPIIQSTAGNRTIMTTSGAIHVQGVVNGKITVLSDDKIYLENNLVYASDPRVNPNSDDYLGLIAKDKVIVPDNATTNLEIHAAIVAMVAFEVENYDSGTPRGDLTILGSLVLASDSRSGTFDGLGNLLTGFNRILQYDSRLIDKTPPYFPRLDRVEMVFRSD